MVAVAPSVESHPTVQYQILDIGNFYPLVNVIRKLPSQSNFQQISMSLSSESFALRRKRTATQRAENNGDPLAANKKARAAAKSKDSTSTPAQASTSTNGVPVSSYSNFLVFKTYLISYPVSECPPSFFSPHGRD